MDYVWDPDKAARNLQKHFVSFETAVEALEDPLSVVEPDPFWREDRWRTIGLSSQGVLFVVTTEPDEDTVRIISAREATRHEKAIYAWQARS